MSYLALASLVFGAVGLGASILGAFLTAASRRNGELTRTVLREVIAQQNEQTRALIQQMRQETQALLERMDQRADERHRESLEAIKALRAE